MCAVPAVASFFVLDGWLLSQPIFDPTQTVAGFDILTVLSAGTIVGAVGSYFVGAAAPTIITRLFQPKLHRAMQARQADFYSRIRTHRANIPTNPAKVIFRLDFHGEKIDSVSAYRGWLRTQRNYFRQKDFK